MDKPKFNCPVPETQRPENEYKALKKSLGFAWATYETKPFFRKIFFLVMVTYTMSMLVFLNSYRLEQNLHDLLLYIPTFANMLFILIILRSYLGWRYIYTRLVQATVTYEESGWYDGQVWVKTNEVLAQDTLIGTYELLPILKRLQSIILVSIAITLSNVCVWNFIVIEKSIP